MQIHYARIAAFFMALVAVIILIRYRHPIIGFLSNLERIGPYHSLEDQATGLIALGLIGVFVVAIVRVLTQSRGE